jgi:uncharacterized membrane protein
MSEAWATIAGLAGATFAIRLGGYLLGRRLPQTGRWARGLAALPGSLIAALVTFLLIGGGVQDWLAALVALGVAALSRSLPLTMIAGVAAVWALRHGLL